MNTLPQPRPQSLRAVSVASVVFGILGAGFFWWVPLGMVFSLAGLMLGFIDSLTAKQHSLTYRLSVTGLIISAIALILCLAIAALGWQSVTFGSLR
jgi:hypothetical protein